MRQMPAILIRTLTLTLTLVGERGLAANVRHPWKVVRLLDCAEPKVLHPARYTHQRRRLCMCRGTGPYRGATLRYTASVSLQKKSQLEEFAFVEIPQPCRRTERRTMGYWQQERLAMILTFSAFFFTTITFFFFFPTFFYFFRQASGKSVHGLIRKRFTTAEVPI